MESDDRVDEGDAALQKLLASMAEHSRDVERRDRLLDCSFTVPPLADWPTDHLAHLAALRETCQYVISLARMTRELNQLNAIDE